MKENNQSNTHTKTDINVVDLLLYLLYHWKWYVVSLLVCVAIAWIRYSKSERIYGSSIKVYIKDSSSPNSGRSSSVGLDKFNDYINKVDVANEILQLQSKTLLKQVISRLHIDISYEIKHGFHQDELYKQSPVSVCFIDSLRNPSVSLVVKLIDCHSAEISQFNYTEDRMQVVKLNEVIETSAGRLIISPTCYCGQRYWGIPIYVTKHPVAEVAHFYHEHMSIKQEMDETDTPTSVLTISLHDSSPLRAQDVLNTLINIYNEKSKEDKNQIALNAEKFINNRISIIGKELGNVESDMAGLQRSNKVLDVNTSAGVYMGRSQKYNEDVMEMETQLHLAEFMRSYLTNPTKSSELIPSNAGIKDMNIESQVNQYNTLKLRRDKLIEGNNDKNPVVQDLSKTMMTLKKNIIHVVDNVIASIRLQKNDAEGRDLNAQAQYATLPAKQQEFISIGRQQKVKDELYTYLLNKREENALTQAMVANNARIIDTSDDDFSPISPNRNKNLLLGVLSGLMIPTILFLLKMFLDTRVRNRKDIEDAVSIPFLGEIPWGKRKKGTDELEQEEGIVSEAFRVLRTNMGFMLKNKNSAQIVTVSSFSEGSGKTFIATRLAKSLIMINKKVLLIDLDIRRGTMSRHFHIKGNGITNYLADDTIKISDILHQDSKDSSPDMIGSGSIAPNPAELLMNSRLDELIEEVRFNYDYIIVDNVPIGFIADASITNRIMDMTIFVIRFGKLDCRQLPDIEQLYENKKLNNMTIVLNGSEIEHRKYGYGYGYSYGYSYGDTSKKKNRFYKFLRNL